MEEGEGRYSVVLCESDSNGYGASLSSCRMTMNIQVTHVANFIYNKTILIHFGHLSFFFHATTSTNHLQ